MRVGDAMTKVPVTVQANASVAHARELMALRAIRHLLVVDGSRLVGILSDRDVRTPPREVVDGLPPLRSDLAFGRYRPVSTVMSAPVITAAPSESLADAAGRMRRAGVHALAVTEGAKVVGIITATDCLAWIERHLHRGERARVALVVAADAGVREREARKLAVTGYDVTTCPGPLRGTACPGLQGKDGEGCVRVRRDLDVVVVDQRSARTKLLEAYHAWRPRAEIRIVDDGDESPPDPPAL